MGDGVMAAFGAPVPTDDHRRIEAVEAARSMITEKLPEFNRWLRDIRDR